jgi:hypothetical protein
MNNIYLRNTFTLHVLILPAPLLLQAKEVGDILLDPSLHKADRGWGEFMRYMIEI